MEMFAGNNVSWCHCGVFIVNFEYMKHNIQYINLFLFIALGIYVTCCR